MMKTAMYRIYNEYFMGDRTQYMSELLGRLKARGYEFYSVLDFSRAVKSSTPLPEKTCIIRVDVDSDPHYCKVISRVFRKNECTASFYFRLETINRRIMHELDGEGFEVGYHYEELATYAKQHHLKTRESIMTKIDDCHDLFRKNFAYFTKVLGSHPKTVSSHGDFANRKLGITNSVIVNQALRDELGLEAEAYDDDLTSKFDDSIIDMGSPHWWKPISPECAANNRKEGPHCMRILLHPKQWRKNFYWNTRQNIERIVQGLRY